MAKDRRSRNQKRKAKLAKRTRKNPETRSLAYSGKKYRKPEFVPLILAVETAILEAYVMSERELVDQQVVDALTRMITDLRHGGRPIETQPELDDQSAASTDFHSFLIPNIRSHLDHALNQLGTCSTDLQVGILRTVLGSIETWTTSGHASQGYLGYIERFLKTVGVRVEKFDGAKLQSLAREPTAHLT